MKYLGEQSPGPGQDAAKWIIAKGVRLAGDDTATFEKRPAAYGKELFSVSAAKTYAVAFVITPLKIQGASGSPLRAIALVP